MNLLPLALLAAILSPQVSNGPINYETSRLERRIHALKVNEKITIDGRFDEPAWKLAPVARDFTQREPREGARETEPTEIRVLYDDVNLYFGIAAKDSETNRIIINELRKDFNVDNGDSVEIILDTFHDERNAYRFAT